jgi:folate-dependent phosphoribosylglycinamide formyltransferase PurN
MGPSPVRTLLICHHDSRLDREFLPRWLASFSEFVGIVNIRDPRQQLLRRSRREIKRSGLLGLADVVAFRMYYRLLLAQGDATREQALARALELQYPALPEAAPVHETESPNDAATAAFIAAARPDVVLARCKHLLKREVFSIARTGTFAMHPGICPQYRNAHGCFWALANGDRDNVGMTLLKIDAGIDTGPIFGFFKRPLDDPRETHASIQNRVVFENLPAIRDTLLQVHDGSARPLEVSGNPSAVWGQPRLTAYWRWRRAS